MDGKENRKVMERYKAENCTGTIDNAGQPYEVVDINRRGALLRGDRLYEGSGQLTFLRNFGEKDSEIILEKLACTFEPKPLRKDMMTQKEHSIAFFKKELTPLETVRFNSITRATPKNNPELWNLMLSDNKEVKEEIYHIERCRSDIFLAVIAAIFVAALAVGCLIVKDDIRKGAFAVASIVTFLMFLLGTYTSLEKANAINERRGFLANLSDYIRLGQMPISYQGWSKIKYFFRDCGMLMRLKCCPVKHPENIHPKHLSSVQNNENNDIRLRHACRIEGSTKAKEMNLAKKFMPGMNDSFMSLCSYVYSCLYGFSLVVFSYFAIYAIESFLKNFLNAPDFTISPKNYIWLYGSVLAGAFSSMVFLMKYRKYIVKEGLVILALIVLTLFASTFSKLDVSQNNYLMFGCVLAFFAGCLMGSIGGHLLNSLYVLRKGSKSAESYYFAWKKAIEHCFAATDLNDPALKYSPDKWRDRLILCMQRFTYNA